MAENEDAPIDETPANPAEQRMLDSEVRRVPKNALKEHMDRINNRNANREATAESLTPGMAPSQQTFPRPPKSATEQVKATMRDDPADPAKPVSGPTEIIEEVVRHAQRFGVFPHWPREKQAEVMGLVTRTIKQHAIAQQVAHVQQRDTVHARAYRERRRLAREAATLVRTYFQFGEVQKERCVEDPVFYTEALNYMGRFLMKVGSLPELPGDENPPPEEKTDA